MDLTGWARQQGIHPQTAYRWFREGTLPVPAVRISSRSVLVFSPDASTRPGTGCYGLYARVSCHDQRDDVDRRLARLTRWAGGQVVWVEAEVGSGMHGSRSRVRRMLADPRVTAVVVEHRDRLGRMNTGLVEAALSAHGRSLVVLDDGEVEDDLVWDVVEVLTSFCARVYGRRSARNRAVKAVGCAQRGIGPAAVVGAQRKDAGRA